ncbi:hypothetical protein TKK_0002064 [Trichogramma kaykai]|uniref:Kinetochore protein SPC25 n=1 Tax=Trichogramma kaykai TaxID=54128 RepID=A0ABD2X9L0_9HYME
MTMTEHDELLSVDLESILLNSDQMNAYIKKLKDNCAKFQKKLEQGVHDTISKSSEHAKQYEYSSNALSRLTHQMDELKTQYERIKTEQKINEKKTSNIIKEVEKAKASIESLNEKHTNVISRIVDLEEEDQKSKDKLKKQWGALKKSYKWYKDILDVHIDSKMIDSVEHVTVTFFWSENPTNHNYFVELINRDNCWKVNKIQPELTVEQKHQLEHVIKFSKQSEVCNVTLLLYELRKFFIKIYLDSNIS